MFFCLFVHISSRDQEIRFAPPFPWTCETGEVIIMITIIFCKNCEINLLIICIQPIGLSNFHNSETIFPNSFWISDYNINKPYLAMSVFPINNPNCGNLPSFNLFYHSSVTIPGKCFTLSSIKFIPAMHTVSAGVINYHYFYGNSCKEIEK